MSCKSRTSERGKSESERKREKGKGKHFARVTERAKGRLGASPFYQGRRQTGKETKERYRG
jgi:hypothetical protein